MRKPMLCSFSLAMASVLLVAACGSSSKTSSTKTSTKSTPVALSGTVNNHGTKDVSTDATAKVAIEINDFYFNPTFVKTKPGSTITVSLKNASSTEHTFTIDGSSVDQDLQPGATADVQVTIPQNGALQFHCRFHQGSGMQGALYTADGAPLQNATTGSTTGSTRSGSSYNY